MRILAANTSGAIAEAAAVLKSGGLVGLPTETVYGLAADATNGRAVAAIFAAKGRPAFNPLIVHVETTAQAETIAVFDERAHAVATAFWPGPLTIILPRRADAKTHELATAGLGTVALRCPAHPVARAVIAAAGVPLAAPSANASGTLSPTSPAHVAASLGDAVDIILAAGSSVVGLESTVLDLSEDVPVVLRPGAVTPDQLGRVLGATPAIDDGAHDAPKSPGQLLRHYAPKTRLRLNAAAPEAGEAYLAFGPMLLTRARIDPAIRNLSPNGDLAEAAANLFAFLHDLDGGGYAGIAVAPIPQTGLGLAINDRLRRAAGGQ
ncbi:MAG: threonylcarbamoyl-AMP synthase [Rhodospirillales bacterium]|nr:threonylcarbamoyl-AMP synthase [Alphaproteobacteria bacterium]MCB9986358.1 threonylcarbamoyl-AMP synthase [Rhodospirillales bacterium]USO07093.1 MAG: threonylcarbamoyl-AMP synthase [Rhodospirillales bacterium]